MQKEDDDGDGNSSFTCLKKCINIGSSGTFETYDKSDTDVIGGWGTPVSVFYFGETQKCRVEVAHGGEVPPSQAAATGANTVAGTSASSTTSTKPQDTGEDTVAGTSASSTTSTKPQDTGEDTVAGPSASSTTSTKPQDTGEDTIDTANESTETETETETETSSNGSPSSSQGPGLQLSPDALNVENSADGIPVIAACILLPLFLLTFTKNLVP